MTRPDGDSVADFMADLIRAAEERDMTVVEVQMSGAVRLIHNRTGLEIDLRGVFISGDMIRRLFAVQEQPR